MKLFKLVLLLLIPATAACEQEAEPTVLENVHNRVAPAQARKNSGTQQAPVKGVPRQVFDNLVSENEKSD